MRASWRTTGIIEENCDLLWSSNTLLNNKNKNKNKNTKNQSSLNNSSSAVTLGSTSAASSTSSINTNDKTQSNVIAIDLEDSQMTEAKKYTKFKVFDVGSQRSERRKWIHIVDMEGNNNVLLYVVALNHYCEVLFEDHSIHSMWEAINLFDELLNLRLFRNLACFSSIIVFLNKKDLFCQRIQRGLKLSELCFNDQLCQKFMAVGASYTYEKDKDLFIYSGPEFDGTWEWDDSEDIESDSKAAAVAINVEGTDDNYMNIHIPKGDNNGHDGLNNVDGLGRLAELERAIDNGIAFIENIFRMIAERRMIGDDFEQKYYSHVTIAINSDSIENGLNSVVRNVVANNLELKTFDINRNVSSML